ncbi:hypothetical protein BDK51DRAFT_53139 [Blyttiomyces helicus]|uniref:Uncharacterized protein n=1 Tax=Blyttiomyces helicus TaxID=388810 RepID=A0A4P9WKZ2_9FUNG|nr:hypothetical protein BDK51DRAFT_53139 [Blyttiomyces helicus]|eukprot:RKO93504.1 hypothetical protein BDK51DRAFT_53139 [Blyttiomyces helicus]
MLSSRKGRDSSHRVRAPEEIQLSFVNVVFPFVPSLDCSPGPLHSGDGVSLRPIPQYVLYPITYSLIFHPSPRIPRQSAGWKEEEASTRRPKPEGPPPTVGCGTRGYERAQRTIGSKCPAVPATCAPPGIPHTSLPAPTASGPPLSAANAAASEMVALYRDLLCLSEDRKMEALALFAQVEIAKAKAVSNWARCEFVKQHTPTARAFAEAALEDERAKRQVRRGQRASLDPTMKRIPGTSRELPGQLTLRGGVTKILMVARKNDHQKDGVGNWRIGYRYHLTGRSRAGMQLTLTELMRIKKEKRIGCATK